uniref:Uncharacterized protein n=1 Tax=Parascaris equorum TaxID=6256 RepID=A0A914S1W9_PAREQ
MVASGAITIAPDLRTVPGFNMYFKGLGPSNTFLREYWNSLNCTNKHENFGECFLDLGITFQQEAYVPSVVDAVNVVAMALHRYVKGQVCNIYIGQRLLTVLDSSESYPLLVPPADHGKTEQYVVLTRTG